MKYYSSLILIITCCCSLISASEFTISSYNCGGLSDHYDYLRAAAMQKLIQERYQAEPEQMMLNEKMQKLALKILFSPNLLEKTSAEEEWEQKNYEHLFESITAAPNEEKSMNAIWSQKCQEMMTSYKERPVSIFDEEVNQMLRDQIKDLTKQTGVESHQIEEARGILAKRLFNYYLKQDVICLQEADYIQPEIFPDHYTWAFAQTSHSKNAIAWNKNRFKCLEEVGNLMGRAFIVKLQDLETQQTFLVVSGHLTGCNPYRVEVDSVGNKDSLKGDLELQAIVKLLEDKQADYMLMGLDSNVTAHHPRLNIFKEAGYLLDYENFLESTCTNPYQMLNTRIDWIVGKSSCSQSLKITNIPVFGVGLNSIQTNISDHKPVAAKICY